MAVAKKIPGSVNQWFEDNLDNGYLKVLAGVRGAGKTFALEKIRRRLVKEGVPEANIISVDFENPINRRIKTCRDALGLMDLDSRPGIKHVFLDEVGFLPDHRKLLGVLFADKECRVLLSTSNARVLHAECLAYFAGCVTRYDLFPDPERRRSGPELEGVWNKSLVRDVLGGNSLADAYAEERIAEYLSDNVGEFLSSRRVAEDVTFGTRKLAHVTAGLYMQLLEDAFVVEKIPVWDAFSGVASTRRFAYYFTDLELREYFFGSTGDEARERFAKNSAYLALRRRFQCPVYVARPDDAEADFATVSGSQTRFWSASRKVPGEVTEVQGKLI